MLSNKKRQCCNIFLLLHSVPLIHGANYTISVLDGDDAMLPCILPPHLTENNTVYWYYRGEMVSDGENITVPDRDRYSLYRPYKSDWFLNISPVRIVDEGRYQCIVEDVFNSTAKLIVESPPAVTGYATDTLYLQVCDTARVTLYCNVTGLPRPTIKWYYKQAANSELVYLRLNTERIFIPEVDHASAGVYICQVSNTHGETDMQFHITVADLVTVLNEDVDTGKSSHGDLHAPTLSNAVSNCSAKYNYKCIILLLYVSCIMLSWK